MPGIAAAVRRAADALADAGHDVAEAVPPTYERAIELWVEMLLPDVRSMRPLLEDVMGADVRPFLDFAAIEYPPIDISTWALLFAERHGVLRDWGAFFDTVGRAADTDLDAAAIRPRCRHRLTRRSPQHPVDDAAGAPGEPARPASRGRAGRSRRRTARRRAAHRRRASPTSWCWTWPRPSRTQLGILTPIDPVTG